MSSTIDANLEKLGITIPNSAAPAANYMPWVRDGDLLYISGQLPFKDGKVAVEGHLGQDVSVEDGQDAAKWCAVNILAQVKAAVGSLDNIEQVIKLGAFVSCAPDFKQHPQVVNGASDFMVEVLGDKGRHARAAVGMSSLPLNAAVEIEAIIRVKA